MRRMAIPSSAVLLFTLTVTTPVLAAAPINDTYDDRTVIAGLPYSETLDTSEATSDAYDAELNTECEAPAIDASVWYEFTAPADMDVLVDVSASDYSAGVFVATGSPGSFGPVEACGPGAVVFAATSGTTYVLMVIDDQLDGGGNGGTLELNVTEAPPSPEVTVSVDPTGRFDSATGSATISGTVTCTDGATAFVDVSLSQQVGRFVVRGFGFTEIICDGTAQAWSVEVMGETGLFKGGKAVAAVGAQACTEFDCGFASEEASVRLRR